MSKRKRQKKKRSAGPGKTEASSALRFSKVNAVLAGAALLAIVLGYVLLAGGSVTLAPILLVVGYVILMPLAIVL